MAEFLGDSSQPSADGDATEQRPDPAHPVSFLIAFALGFLIVAAPLIRLVITGEMFPQLASTLATRPILHGRVFQDYADHKLGQFAARRARIAVIGSSRVMRLREGVFNVCLQRYGQRCFYNLGGTMPTPEVALDVLRAAPASAWPKVLLIGIDLWAVNPNYTEDPKLVGLRERTIPTYIQTELNYGTNVLLRARDDQGLRQTLISSWSYAGNYARVGLMALGKDEGFRPDGSYRNHADDRPPIGPFLDDARARSSRFTAFGEPDPARLEILRQMIRLARTHNTNVIGFAPPFSDDIVAALSSDRSWVEFAPALEHLFASENSPFVDFSRLSAGGCVPNDSSDGIHATELCMARIGLSLAVNPATSRHLAADIDTQQLQAAIDASARPHFGAPD